jgi:hypothetical protein
MSKNEIDGRGEGGTHRLEDLVEEFRRWRQTRTAGERIPVAMWDAAVQMCQEHAPKRVAYKLRVGLATLMRHLERGAQHSPMRSALETEFVEVFLSPTPRPVPTADTSVANARAMPEPPAKLTPTPTPECVVEMENGQGVKMRVQLSGLGLAQLATLCSAMGGVFCHESRSTA